MVVVWILVAIFTAWAMSLIRKASLVDAKEIEDLDYELKMLEARVEFIRRGS